MEWDIEISVGIRTHCSDSRCYHLLLRLHSVSKDRPALQARPIYSLSCASLETSTLICCDQSAFSNKQVTLAGSIGTSSMTSLVKDSAPAACTILECFRVGAGTRWYDSSSMVSFLIYKLLMLRRSCRYTYLDARHGYQTLTVPCKLRRPLDWFPWPNLSCLTSRHSY